MSQIPVTTPNSENPKKIPSANFIVIKNRSLIKLKTNKSIFLLKNKFRIKLNSFNKNDINLKNLIFNNYSFDMISFLFKIIIIVFNKNNNYFLFNNRMISKPFCYYIPQQQSWRHSKKHTSKIIIINY